MVMPLNTFCVAGMLTGNEHIEICLKSYLHDDLFYRTWKNHLRGVDEKHRLHLYQTLSLLQNEMNKAGQILSLLEGQNTSLYLVLPRVLCQPPW